MANKNFRVRHGLTVSGDSNLSGILQISGNTSVGGVLRVESGTSCSMESYKFLVILV